MSALPNNGTWEVVPSAHNGETFYTPAIGVRESSLVGFNVALVWDDLEPGAGAANARLIAAAPELLEACINLMAVSDGWKRDGTIFDGARAAIKKATE
jgi:hypothetical protein